MGMADEQILRPFIGRYASAIICMLISTAALASLYTIENQILTRVYTSELARVRAHLENIVADAVAPTAALRSFVIAEGETPPINEFRAFADSLHHGAPYLLAAQLAPDGIVRLTSNLTRNAGAIGHDLFKDPARRDAAMRAIVDRKTVIAGPVKLIQGGDALIARRPIFLPSIVSRTGIPDFYGFATAIVDATPIYDELSAYEGSMALRGRDGLGATGELIFGRPALFESDHIAMEVTLPNGIWVLAHRRPVMADFLFPMFLGLFACIFISAYVIRAQSERRKVHDQASSDAERLFLATRIGNLGFLESDGEGNISMSKGAYRILGIAEGDLPPSIVTDTLQDLFYDPTPSSSCCPPRSFEISFMDDRGNRTVELIWNPIEQNSSIVAVRDITEAADRHNRELSVAKFVSIGELAAGIAHELNTPLQFISDNLDYISSTINTATDDWRRTGVPHSEFIISTEIADDLATEVPAALSDCIVGTERMAQIVAAMKSYAAPNTSSEPTEFDINVVIAHAVSLTSGTHKYLADVTVDAPVGAISTYGDQGGLTQVFINLIINACDAIADRKAADADAPFGKIDIRVTQSNGRYSISLADNGGGIKPEIRDRIFDLFFTTKPMGKGTGQGLAISMAIIKRMHGTINYRPIPPDGGAFILEFPVASGAAILAVAS